MYFIYSFTVTFVFLSEQLVIVTKALVYTYNPLCHRAPLFLQKLMKTQTIDTLLPWVTSVYRQISYTILLLPSCKY